MTAAQATTAAAQSQSKKMEDIFHDRCIAGIASLAAAGRYSLKIHLLTGYGKREETTQACAAAITRLRAAGYTVGDPEDCPNDHLNRQAITITWPS